MYLGDVIDQINSDEPELEPTPGKLRNGMAIGDVDRPPMNSLGFFVFGDEHVEQFKAYLRKPKRRGRKPRAERLAEV